MSLVKKFRINVTIDIEILNEKNFMDFEQKEYREKLIQEMLDQSVWPGEGIGCQVVDSTIPVTATIEEE